MDHLDAGFLEGAGGYWYENTTTGDWIPDFFEAFLEGVIAASTGGKTVGKMKTCALSILFAHGCAGVPAWQT